MPDDSDKPEPIPRGSPTHDCGDMWTSSIGISESKQASDHIKMESPVDGANELNGELWMTTGENGPGASRVPFTKREKEFLCCLIQKHVYSKIGHAQCHLPTLGSFNRSSFCRVPNTAWKAIETEFNEKDNVRPRSIKQLRKCWENLKHRGNINPAALYSGKKLHARTSLSGAFTLTTDGDEGESNLVPPKSSEAFVETTLNENDSARINEETQHTLNSTTQTRDLFSNETTPPRRICIGNNNSSPYHEEDITPNMFQPRTTENSANKSDKRTASPFTASHLIASFSRPTTTSSPFIMTSRPAMISPRITNVRTVRSLKPVHVQSSRKRFGMDSRNRPNGTRPFSNFSMVAKTHTQKIHEMKVKLMNTRIKEHEANVQRVNMQMQQAQAHHDVTMRLLRTKAAFFDAHLRKLEKQLRVGDVSMVGEDDEEYQSGSFSEMDMQYEDDYE